MSKAYLVLSNGDVYEGTAIGAAHDSVGELVFTTGMVGYLETLTDPSYFGQIVVQTFPLIGNYGVIEEDFEGKTAVSGYVVGELCEHPSNFRCQYELNKFLVDNNICGISGVDTRQITRTIREQGVMNAVICSEVPSDLSEVKSFAIKDAVAHVTHKNKVECPCGKEDAFKVVLVDYGEKRGIERSLNERGCDVVIVPYDTSAEDILAMNPDGIMLSNGPGDPADNEYCIAQIGKLIGKKPIFGICLGHQLTALAMGGKTVKLKYGHRGGNQPVTDLRGSRTYITTQNHGYAVVADSLIGAANQTYINANDGSCEGLDYPGLRCFTVQFHPEACAGPRDTEGLFDRFIRMMGGDFNA
ncbi:MAG: carbamoyl phosphate synthase small subunit [Clostridia bacterium]|nr:carbamoyl phosphate synthase small subunit [Clostridia bacterium]